MFLSYRISGPDEYLRVKNLLFHFSDPSKNMLSQFLLIISPVKTLTNLRLDCFSNLTKHVTKLKAHLSNFFWS